VIALTALAFVAAGCAIPTQGAPSTLPSSKVPFDLLDPHPPTTSTTQPKPSSFVTVKAFFINSGTQQLQAVLRLVPSPAPLTGVIGAMLAGPTSGETTGGLVTAIPSDVTVLSATSSTGNIVTVNMNGAFGNIPGNDTELAVAQIVATVATENGFSTGVVFEINGERTSVPIANGSQVTGPVYLIQFLTAAP
jgi:spore germination protein GerM